MLQKIKIGNISLEQTASLAPMASVADTAYRLLCKEKGASYLTSELISAKGYCYNPKACEELCRILPAERPFALQLFGNEPDFMERAVSEMLKYEPDMIDINMGCPVPKVVKGGAGSALLKTPELAEQLVKAAIRGANGIPVTIKMRRGFEESTANPVDFAKRMEQAGAAAVTLHGRTREQFYTGTADWECIRLVKEALQIPVIGNGDVVSYETAKKMYEETGCDLVAVGRGSYGNPFIFDEIRRGMDGQPYTEPCLTERMDTMLRHIQLIIEIRGAEIGEKRAILEARKHAAWYVKGVRNAAALRKACYSLNCYEDAVQLRDAVLSYGVSEEG